MSQLSGKQFSILVAYKHSRADIFVKILEDIADIRVTNLTSDELAEEMKKDYDVVIVDIVIPVSAEMIRNASPKLKAIGTFSHGYDHIDVDEAEERGIKVLNAAVGNVGASTYAVAEHAIGLLIAIVKKTYLLPYIARRGSYSWWDLAGGIEPYFVGTELFGKKLGIIGVGRIGSHIARISSGFKMKVYGYDPYVDRLRVAEDGAELIDDLQELLRISDFLIITAPLTKETRGMIGKEEVNAMKEGIYIVNISRGAIVKEEEIVNGLKEGRIAGYAADVLTYEPPTPDNSPIYREFLKGKLNILITPHTAWLTKETPERYALILGNRVREVLTGEKYTEGDYLKYPASPR